MTTLYNKNHSSVIDGHKDSYEMKKMPNCVLFSQDGYKFKIHEKLLTQTKRMHDIVEDAKDPDCPGTIKIVCFCQVTNCGIYEVMIAQKCFGSSANLVCQNTHTYVMNGSASIHT